VYHLRQIIHAGNLRLVSLVGVTGQKPFASISLASHRRL
jgi:hypothetical protein